MALENFIEIMVMCMKEIGKMVKYMEKVFLFKRMVILMKVIGN